MPKRTLKKIIETCIYLNVDKEAVILNPKTRAMTLLHPRRSDFRQQNVDDIRQAIAEMVKQSK
jgi:hypothetical protein